VEHFLGGKFLSCREMRGPQLRMIMIQLLIWNLVLSKRLCENLT
jgi:hypothetical protein